MVARRESVVVSLEPFEPLGATERDALVAAAELYGSYLGLAAGIA